MAALSLYDRGTDRRITGLFETGFMSDVIVLCKGEELQAHAAILVVGSSYFRGLLQTTTTIPETTANARFVAAPDCCTSPALLRKVITAIYGGHLLVPDGSATNLCQLVRLLNALGVPALMDAVLDELSVRTTLATLGETEGGLSGHDVALFTRLLPDLDSSHPSVACFGRTLARLLSRARQLEDLEFAARTLLHFSIFEQANVRSWGLSVLIKLLPAANVPSVRELALKLCCLLPPTELLRHLDPAAAFGFSLSDLAAAWAEVAEREFGHRVPPRPVVSQAPESHWLTLLRPDTGTVCRIRPRGSHASFRVGVFPLEQKQQSEEGKWLFECGQWDHRPRTSQEMSVRLAPCGSVMFRSGSNGRWEDSGHVVPAGRRVFVVLEVLGPRLFPADRGDFVKCERLDGGGQVVGFLMDVIHQGSPTARVRVCGGREVDVSAKSVCRESTGGVLEWSELLQVTVA